MQVNGMLSPFASPLPTLTELGGGGERDRTDDLLRAKQVLSQLSYTPQIEDCELIIVYPIALISIVIFN